MLYLRFLFNQDSDAYKFYRLRVKQLIRQDDGNDADIEDTEGI